MKRQGEEFAVTPSISVVMSPDDEATSDSISSFTLPNSKTWEATRDAMNQLLERYNDNSNDKSIALIHEINADLEHVEEEEKAIRDDADAIVDEIQNRIGTCSKNFSQEEQNLRQEQRHIQDLECEVDEIRDNNIIAKEEEKQLERKIEYYRELANEHVEQIDEVELEKKEEVYRLQYQISLHATTTGIKWDYDDIHVMSGEIDIPSKQVQKRFSIQRENQSSFEIVNQLWTMMEA